MKTLSPDRARGPILIPTLIAVAGALVIVNQWRWGRMLWLDEEMIAINLRDRSFAQLAGSLSLGQAAPYGWLVVQRALLMVFGTGERALRFVPLAFGVSLLVTAVWVGRRWMTVAGASVLVFLCAAGQWVWFHALELKHYSADTAFGLLLPALAVWAIERDRVGLWWIVAAVAQWFSNGALFAAPACAVVIVFAAARGLIPSDRLPPTQGLGPAMTRALRAALPGLLWLASFGLNDIVSLAPARSNPFLQQFWAIGFPPIGTGVGGTAAWLAARLAPLADKPGSSGYGLLLWATAFAGFVVARRQPLALRLTYALVPISAMLWAAVRLVPLHERMALWVVPSLYVGVALAADSAAIAMLTARDQKRWLRAIAGAVVTALIGLLLIDVARRGTTFLAFDEPIANHALDDRAAIRWLSRERRPGDVWVTTHNALPAIWWYGPAEPGPVGDASFASDRRECGSDEIGAWFRRVGASRALVYLGFGHDSPATFDDTLLARLGSLGSVEKYRIFGENGHGLVIDLRGAPAGPLTLASLAARPNPGSGAAASGCIAVTSAPHW